MTPMSAFLTSLPPLDHIIYRYHKVFGALNMQQLESMEFWEARKIKAIYFQGAAEH